MVPLPASKLVIVEGVMDDPLMRARGERMRNGFPTNDVREVDDYLTVLAQTGQLRELGR